ncbi:triosephosphate isomerase, cytosolic-like [Hevea brasiliensis]|uniref:triosephosphate isomerase, cytosolic-like n=1 Tax=Hevea brasiliensis TaxID=3981 RepID=UPI0025DAE4E2|nr:triosephosphate isomerase, cytosolic-like [Hevea brasiliensis]
MYNGTTEEVKRIVSILNKGQVPSPDVVEVVISPPFVYLPLVKSLLRPDFQIAAQNCWVQKGGAFNSEVRYTYICYFNFFQFSEISLFVLIDLLCRMLVILDILWVILGHSERRLILNESNEFVGDKVAYTLSQGLKVIACVGETLEWRESGSTMEVVAAQTKAIAVNATNCKELAAQPDVDGFLLGRASLKLEFIEIIESAESFKVEELLKAAIRELFDQGKQPQEKETLSSDDLKAKIKDYLRERRCLPVLDDEAWEDI